MSTHNPGNDDQIAYWSGATGEQWVAMQARLDNQLDPLGRAALAALAVKPGERIADIGCGSGQTTAQLAAAGATPIGVDVSKPLVAAARLRYPGLELVEADASTYAFPAPPLDAIYSRFGVMFFADPVGAFAHLRGALRDGGRLAFVCWRAASENPIMTVPLEAAIAAGAPRPPAADPSSPGPFALADRDRIATVLASAGWSRIEIAPHDEAIGGNDVAATLELALHIGPLARLLREVPEHRERALAAVQRAIEPYLVGDRVLMPSATWIVTAVA